MTADATDSTSPPQLRRNSLGLLELVFQGITHIAPATSIVFIFPIIALKAGSNMPISFMLATIICFFIGNTVSQFSKYMPSSGGYYSFATRGLGIRSGFMATWSYLIYDILGPAGSTGFLGYLISETLLTEFGVHIPWWLLAVVAFVIIWILTHHGVGLSMRTTAFLGSLEMLIMLALAITFLVRPGLGSTYTAPLRTSLSSHHFSGILAGMVFSVLALSGFEAPAPLAQESRRPSKFISQAVLLSLIGIGVFYVFTSYASVIGWGTGNMAAFSANPNPYYALGHALWGVGWWFILFAIINSVIGAGLACTNAASRVMYTMGYAGTLPAQFAKIHPIHQTPSFAIAFLQLSGIAAVLLVGFLLRPADIFGFLGTIAALAVIILYSIANLALISYIRREHANDFNVWRHAVMPWIGTLALVPVLFVTVYPIPPWPYNITPYLFVLALVFGVVYMQWREFRNPGVLRRGATLLVGSTGDAEGEADWGTPAAPLAK
ncbi:MAG TPA: APC family permease [Acidobacteriaceae bacterium]|nr:APC family permease [Acidobacteriaceae bacterium]